MEELHKESNEYPLKKTTQPSQGNTIYQNGMQANVLSVSASTTGLSAGRGAGKTATLSGHTVLCNQSIPRGCDIMLGSSYAQIFGRTMPAMVKEIERTWHWVEGVQFFRGHAPKAANFPEPLAKPRSWSNCIHWYTGAVTQLCSMAVKGSTNGLSITSLRCDETRYIPWDNIAEEVRPAIRPFIYDHPGWKIGKNPYFCSQWYVSDAGLTPAQNKWIAKLKSEETPEVNSEIARLLGIADAAAEGGWYDQLLETPGYMKKLNAYRAKATYVHSYTTAENLEVLGGREYIERQKRQLPPLVFQLQFMNGTPEINKSDLYYSYSDEIHSYIPDQTLQEDLIKGKYGKKFLSRVDIGGMTKKVEWEAPDLDDLVRAHEDCSLDVDCLPNEPLYITLDANKNINTFCVAQRYSMNGLDSCVILKSMYVLNERRLRSLCSDFHKYYAPHQLTCPDIFLYYDDTSKQGGAYALEESDQLRFYNVIKDELSRRGWKVHLVCIGQPMEHDKKYQLVNDVLGGFAPYVVRINRIHNDYLIASIASTKVVKKGNYYRKDKSREKLQNKARSAVEMEGIASAETITDMSDAFDNMLIGMRYFPQGRGSVYGIRLSGIPLFGVDVY